MRMNFRRVQPHPLIWQALYWKERTHYWREFQMSERKRQAASFILGILFGGALVGAGTHFYFSRCMTLACHHQPPQKQPFLLELRGRLNLTADQEKKIGEIIESKRKKIEAMRGAIRPEMKKLREESRDKIR